MSFAQSQLAKYGWKAGEGLGKEKQGRSRAVKGELKRDSAGVGHAGDDFGFNWWDHCYNKAAAKIEVGVCEKSGDVKVTAIKTDVKTTLGVRAVPANLLYGCFVKAKGDDAESSDDESKDYSSLSKLTSEEIFKACGGRTAHKAARHGHRQVAKLNRTNEAGLIASLEAATFDLLKSTNLLELDGDGGSSSSTDSAVLQVEAEKLERKRLRKEKKLRKQKILDTESEELSVKSKKTKSKKDKVNKEHKVKKQKKDRVKNHVAVVEAVSNDSGEREDAKKKVKTKSKEGKKRKRDREVDTSESVSVDGDTQIRKKRKKSKKE
ncbi:hypothetical protein SARC_12171 [Sphaeroforma arctica JP610]|uniref:G-patch domain-containing protein n=1 Tax=Sphaeroforma arctica JP610 TaxID=667725 RepID=A0A0L0FFP2_9EUKA|nr:hypothetical protein SARC_12171 [Sphaeroforma arctica JP610]KNC75301.1 hypothetical protein SARC_12171 [Sphaeroforma arctica JP610]|eukprot:XP_014149203.1 hypothetical protein SARC_12171 [Sphaeroforma arctica JP610]